MFEVIDRTNNTVAQCFRKEANAEWLKRRLNEIGESDNFFVRPKNGKKRFFGAFKRRRHGKK